MNSSPDSTSSVWWAEPGPEFPSLENDLDAEVLVVGGGITGVTLAYTLADQGASVAMLESGRVAGAASGRNAGFLLAAPAEPYAENIAMWGRDGARAVLQIGRRNHQRIRQLIEQHGIACDYRQVGSLRLTRSPEESEDIRSSLPEMRHDGFPMREIPVAGAVPAHAAEFFDGAFDMPEDGELDPVRFLRGVAVEAVRKGARLFEQSPVTTARWQGGLWEARANGRVVRARTLVVATNAYAPKLLPQVANVIAPRRGQMLCTEPLDFVVAPKPTYAQWGYHYWRQTIDGRIVIGGWRDIDIDREVGYVDAVTDRIQSAIEQGLLELVPEAPAIERRWSGVMGFARDGRPLVGWLDAAHHLAVCCGYTGHGMGMAAACTLDLAELLQFKRAAGIASFDPHRYPELRDVREGIVALGAGA